MNSLEDIEWSLADKCTWCKGSGRHDTASPFCRGCCGTGLVYYCDFFESDYRYRAALHKALAKSQQGETPPWRL